MSSNFRRLRSSALMSSKTVTPTPVTKLIISFTDDTTSTPRSLQSPPQPRNLFQSTSTYNQILPYHKDASKLSLQQLKWYHKNDLCYFNNGLDFINTVGNSTRSCCGWRNNILTFLFIGVFTLNITFIKARYCNKSAAKSHTIIENKRFPTKNAAFVASSHGHNQYSCNRGGNMNHQKPQAINIRRSLIKVLQPLESNEYADNLANEMKDRASNETPYTPEEIAGILKSLSNVDPVYLKSVVMSANKNLSERKSSINVESLSEFLSRMAHLSHKDWKRTGKNAEVLHQILLNSDYKQTGIDSNDVFRTIFDRVLREGNWDGALEFSQKRKVVTITISHGWCL